MLDSSPAPALGTERDRPLLRREPQVDRNTRDTLKPHAVLDSRALAAAKPFVHELRKHTQVPGEASDRFLGGRADEPHEALPAVRGRNFHRADRSPNWGLSQLGIGAGEPGGPTQSPFGYAESMTPWDRIAIARKKLSISQLELAKRTGLAHSVVNKLEAGLRPNAGAETIRALAGALGVSTDWILNGEEAPRRDEAEEGPIEAGFRRFREYVRDREAQHLALVPEFIEWRSRGASRYPATISALDVEEELVIDFRRWRRGRDVGDGAGAAMVRSKTGRALPGTE